MKGTIGMVNITKEEVKLMRKFFPHIHIRRTIHKYYMEENRRAVEFLKNIRNGV